MFKNLTDAKNFLPLILALVISWTGHVDVAGAAPEGAQQVQAVTASSPQCPLTASGGEGGSQSDDILPGQTLRAGSGGGLEDTDDSFPAAALELGTIHTGEVRDRLGEEVDTLSFTLTEQLTVRIDVVGETALAGVLYDEHGRPLAALEGDAFAITTTLPPGRYFVRIGTIRAQGAYALSVNPVVPW